MDKTIDIGKAFTYAFEDSDWAMKGLLGALISMIPILNFAAVGYEVQVVRNVSKGEPRPMPAWDDLGDLFMNGLILALARIVVSLPLTLAAVFAFGSAFLVPFLSLVLISDTDSAAAERTMGVIMGSWFLLFCGGLLVVGILSALIGFVYPAMTANFARRGTFGACFEVGEIFGFIRRNFSNYIMVWLAGLLAGMLFVALAMVLYFIPCLGQLLLIPLSMAGVFYIYMINGHAVGQALALDPGPDRPALAAGST